MRGGKGSPRLGLEELAEAARAPVHLRPDPSAHNDSWFVLTGCRKGTVPKALVDHGPSAAERQLHRLVDAFGRHRVLVELWDHGDPLDRSRNDALATLAARAGVEIVATNNVHYATPRERPLATALAAIRARRPLDALDGWLPAAAGAHLRSPAEQHRRFARWPGAIERTTEIANACAFDLAMAAPHLPDFPVPPGHDEMSWLRELAWAGADYRYPPEPPQARRGQAPHRRRARPHRGARLRRLLPPRPRPRRVLPPREPLLPGPGQRGQLRRLLRPRHHQGRRRRARPPLRTVPLPGAGRAARHRPRHRARAPGGGHPVRLPPLRAGPGRPGGQRHHLPAPLRSAGDGQGRRPLTRRRRRRGQVGRGLDPAGSRSRRRRRPHQAENRRGSRDPAAGARPRPPGAGLPPPPRHPLRRHGHRRPPAGRVLPDRVGDDGEPLRPPVGQGRLRRGRPREVRPPRPRHADDAAPGRRPDPGAPGSRDRPGHHPPGGRRLRPPLRRRHRRRLPGREPGPDGHPAEAAAENVLRHRHRGGAHPPGPDPGRFRAPLHPPPPGRGAGHLPPPAPRRLPGQDTGRAAVPGAAHADGHRRGQLHPRRGRPAPPGHGLQALPRADGRLCGNASWRAWRRTASPARWPTRSPTSSRPSPTSVSPRATR